MPSSAEVTRAIDSGVAAIVAASRRVPCPTVLIDGRSGAGKTTIARAVASALGAHLLQLDQVYPGWDGLAAGAESVRSGVLEPRAHGGDGTWERWDWEAGAAAEEHVVPRAQPLVVEGVGILTEATRALSDIQVWVESPTASRRHRALERDGEAYRPHWERWAAQEQDHIRRHDPVSRASIVITVP